MKKEILVQIANVRSIEELEVLLPIVSTNGVKIGNYFCNNQNSVYFDGSLRFPTLPENDNGWLVGKSYEFKVAKFYVKDVRDLDELVASNKGCKILRISSTTFLAKYKY